MSMTSDLPLLKIQDLSYLDEKTRKQAFVMLSQHPSYPSWLAGVREKQLLMAQEKLKQLDQQIKNQEKDLAEKTQQSQALEKDLQLIDQKLQQALKEASKQQKIPGSVPMGGVYLTRRRDPRAGPDPDLVFDSCS
jgi:hypothetical protein